MIRINNVIFFILISIASVFFIGLLSNPKIKTSYKNFDVSQVYAMINNPQKKGNLVVLDVRTSEEYLKRHIKGSLNIDFYAPDFLDRIKKLDRKKEYIVYCRSGNRSQSVVLLMIKEGFPEVYNMTAGFIDWVKRGYPVEK